MEIYNKRYEKKHQKIIEQMFDICEKKSFLMLEYLNQILDKNEFINLTAVKNSEEAFEKHIIDSLFILNLDEYAKATSVLDIGTGAGFPGAILSIASSNKKFILLDSTLKKLKIIDELAEKYQINNLKTIHARAEELNKKVDYCENFDLVVTRAVANMAKLAEWCLPFIKKEGYMIAYKGENYEQEIKEAGDALKKFGGEVYKIEKCKTEYKSIDGHVLIVVKKK